MSKIIAKNFSSWLDNRHKKAVNAKLDKVRAEIEKLIKMKKGLLPTCGDNTTWLIKKGEIVGLEQALLVVDAQREAKK